MKHLAGLLALGMIGAFLALMHTPQMDQFTKELTAAYAYLEGMGSR